jgi:hypothetical protein
MLDEVGGEVGKEVVTSPRIAGFKGDGVALYVSEVAQALPGGLEEG